MIIYSVNYHSSTTRKSRVLFCQADVISNTSRALFNQLTFSPCAPLQWRLLILYHIHTLDDASASDDFWKHCGNRIKCSFSFYHNVFINPTLIYRLFLYFCLKIFNVVCYRCVVCCKWLKRQIDRTFCAKEHIDHYEEYYI